MGREDIDVDRVLDEPELVQNIGRNDHHVAGLHHVLLALRVDFGLSLRDPGDLLVDVVMKRNGGPFLHDPFDQGQLRSVQLLPLDQRRHLIDRLRIQIIKKRRRGAVQADRRKHPHTRSIHHARPGGERRDNPHLRAVVGHILFS